MTSLRDIPAMLRRMATEIEAGEYGALERLLVIMPPKTPENWPRVFSFGEDSLAETVLLLELAKAFNLIVGNRRR